MSSTLLIASVNSSDVIPEETRQFTISSSHLWVTDVLTMYIFFTENNPEPDSSSAKEEAHTSSTGRLFYDLHVIISAI